MNTELPSAPDSAQAKTAQEQTQVSPLEWSAPEQIARMIDRQIRALEQERARKIKTLREKYNLKIAAILTQLSAQTKPETAATARAVPRARGAKRTAKPPRHLRAVAAGRTNNWSCTTAVNAMLKNVKANGTLI